MKKTGLTKLKHKLLQDRKYANYHMEKDVATELSCMVVEARLIRGLTQAQLAKKIGIEQPTIARIESGRSLPSIAMIQRITKAWDMTFILTL